MMQVSQFHKDKGDEVGIYDPKKKKNDFDKVYAFSLFDYTPKDRVTPDMICGGTGFDIYSKLPREIQESKLDYSIFPKCKTSYIWFSRGCIRNCPFCIVREKEGYIHSVEPKNLNPNGEFITVVDNNFFANPKWHDAVKQLNEWEQPINLMSFDIRIFNREQGEALKSIKHKSRVRFAWDNPKDNLEDKIELLLEYFRPYKLMCLFLIGYNSTIEEDFYRIEKLKEYKIDSFAMPFNKKDPYQKALSRWVNHKAIFKKVKWEDYKYNPFVNTESNNINGMVKESGVQ